MADERILIVEDEATVAEVVARYLTRDGYTVRRVADGAHALPVARDFRPDLVVLDIMLPHRSGLEICRALRAQGNTPIIMLTARDEETDKILGLGLGADDYVTKPFSPRELVARVKAVLRRAASPSSVEAGGDVIRAGDVAIDLTAKEFDLLAHIAAHPGRVYTREHLLHAVWGYDYFGDESTVTVHVR